jgi:hypothetical protein
MNCTVNSTATKQRGVGRIHNRIDLENRDVAPDDLDSAIRVFLMNDTSCHHSDFTIPSSLKRLTARAAR